MFRAKFFSMLGALSILVALLPAVRAAAQEGRVVRPEYGRFDVEVVVGGSPLEAMYGRGRRYVEAREGSEYELVVRNPLPVRVAVALSVDGLNTIDARRTSAWESSKWVIEPYGTVRIKGWQTSSTNARRFYFTTERDSYAAKLGRASDLGVITAVFYPRERAAPRSAAAAALLRRGWKRRAARVVPKRRPRGSRAGARGEEWRLCGRDRRRAATTTTATPRPAWAARRATTWSGFRCALSARPPPR
jgi:hypothetical protein